ISQAEILQSHFDLAARPEVAEALAYIAEIVGEFAPPHEANERLYRMVRACLDALAATPHEIGLVIRYFEVWVLRLAGMLPDLRSCNECEKRFGDDESVFIDAETRARCRACGRGLGFALSHESRAAIMSSQKLAPADF